jgi:hypothetical protein
VVKVALLQQNLLSSITNGPNDFFSSFLGLPFILLSYKSTRSLITISFFLIFFHSMPFFHDISLLGGGVHSLFLPQSCSTSAVGLP